MCLGQGGGQKTLLNITQCSGPMADVPGHSTRQNKMIFYQNYVKVNKSCNLLECNYKLYKETLIVSTRSPRNTTKVALEGIYSFS